MKKNYLLEEIKHNYLISEKYKKTCKYLNYVKHLLILASIVTGCVSISVFDSLVCIPVGITNSAVGIKICVNTAGMKIYKSIIQKKKEKYDEIVLRGKAKLKIIEVLIKSLIDSYNGHGEFVSLNNALRKYNEMKEEIKKYAEKTM